MPFQFSLASDIILLRHHRQWKNTEDFKTDWKEWQTELNWQNETGGGVTHFSSLQTVSNHVCLYAHTCTCTYQGTGEDPYKSHYIHSQPMEWSPNLILYGAWYNHNTLAQCNRWNWVSWTQHYTLFPSMLTSTEHSEFHTLQEILSYETENGFMCKL